MEYTAVVEFLMQPGVRHGFLYGASALLGALDPWSRREKIFPLTASGAGLLAFATEESGKYNSTFAGGNQYTELSADIGVAFVGYFSGRSGHKKLVSWLEKRTRRNG